MFRRRREKQAERVAREIMALEARKRKQHPKINAILLSGVMICAGMILAASLPDIEKKLGLGSEEGEEK